MFKFKVEFLILLFIVAFVVAVFAFAEKPEIEDVTAPVFNSTKLEPTRVANINGLQVHTHHHDGWETRYYKDTLGSGYLYSLSYPANDAINNIRFRSAGGINVTSTKGEAKISVIMSKGKGRWDYGVAIEHNNHSRAGNVDRNGQALKYRLGLSEEDAQVWLGLYEKHYDHIMQMFATIDEVFGEDAFR